MIVYWASLNDNWMLSRAPELVLKTYIQRYKHIEFNDSSQMLICPAVKDYTNNLYSLRSLQSYEFYIDTASQSSLCPIKSNMLDQSFFEDRVSLRNLEAKMFSFKANTFLFFAEESLEVTYPIHPYLEDNTVSSRIMPITGTFDIGKWFRPLDFAFMLKDQYNSFKIEKDEIFAYIKFHTNAKIKFKQFVITPELSNYTRDCTVLTKYAPLKTLENYYKLFKTKTLILKEIKKNLINE